MLLGEPPNAWRRSRVDALTDEDIAGVQRILPSVDVAATIARASLLATLAARAAGRPRGPAATVAQLFAAHIPTSGTALAAIRVVDAFRFGLAAEIAAAGNVEENYVRNELELAKRNEPIANVIVEVLRPRCDDDDYDDDDDDFDARVESLLAGVSAEALRLAPSLMRWLARRLETTELGVAGRIERLDAATRLDAAFAPGWRRTLRFGLTPALGEVPVGALLRSSHLCALVAEFLFFDLASVKNDALQKAPSVLVRQLYPTWGLETAGSFDEEDVMPLPGDVVRWLPLVDGRFQPTRLLGRGGFAEVYEARDLTTGALVVLKRLLDPEAAADLTGEFELANRLRHPNICTYLELTEDPMFGRFILMQHGGRSLAKIMHDFRDVPLARAFEVVRQVAGALDYLHASSVMHQDVKPENLLVQENDGRWVVLLSDFGVSLRGRRTEHVDGRPTLAASEVVGFDRGFAAPEQILALPPRRASDQYALARVFCALLLNQRPESDAAFDLGTARLRPYGPALARAFAPEPAERFASCADLVRALGDDNAAP